MADAKNLNQVLKSQQEATKSAEAAEDKKALSNPDAPEGKVLVRLIRPLYLNKRRLEPGPHWLDKNNVPKSAKVLKAATKPTPEVETKVETKPE